MCYMCICVFVLYVRMCVLYVHVSYVHMCGCVVCAGACIKIQYKMLGVHLYHPLPYPFLRQDLSLSLE